MSSWVFGERRGPAWKHGWAEQVVASISAPPLQLVAIFGVVFLLVSLKLYIDYTAHVERTIISFKMFLMLVPLLLILVMQSIDKLEGLVVPYPRWRRPAAVYEGGGGGGSPCGVAILLVVLLVMVSYQSYFHSKWTVWRSDY